MSEGCGLPCGAGTGRRRWPWVQRVFAWVTAASEQMLNRELGERKQALFGQLFGTVLELGPGTGANLSFFPPGVRWIGIEPNPYMHGRLRQKAERLRLQADLRTGSAERIEAPDASVDAVVATLVLCSVDDLGRTLREVQRVLKPGGTFAFVEHVAAPRGTRLRRAQALIRPVWRIVADGCTPDRETWVALEGAGFETLAYDCFRMPSPVGLLSPGIAGKATTHA